jgi:hypothetical protein
MANSGIRGVTRMTNLEHAVTMGEDSAELVLIAHPILEPLTPMTIVPAGAERTWAMPLQNELANRCLPLRMANQAGWVILGGIDVTASWSGEEDPSAIQFEFGSEAAAYPVLSHFGQGILTWIIPYLFRTSPGFNLLARGPANSPRDGIAPLEGLVETDWSVATFTMNWKFTRAGVAVHFAPDDAVCMIVPQRRGDLERFRPVIRELATDPMTAAEHEAWGNSRVQFLDQAPSPQPGRVVWQRHYFNGTTPTGRTAPEHQRKLNLHGFRPDGAASR